MKKTKVYLNFKLMRDAFVVCGFLGFMIYHASQIMDKTDILFFLFSWALTIAQIILASCISIVICLKVFKAQDKREKRKQLFPNKTTRRSYERRAQSFQIPAFDTVTFSGIVSSEFNLRVSLDPYIWETENAHH